MKQERLTHFELSQPFLFSQKKLFPGSNGYDDFG
jgi:hypothetical protein